MPAKALNFNVCAHFCCWGAAADSTESDAGPARQEDKVKPVHFVIGRVSFLVEAKDGVPIECS